MLPLVSITSVYRSYRPHSPRIAIVVPTAVVTVASIVVVNITTRVHIAHVEVRIAWVSIHTARAEPLQLRPNNFIVFLLLHFSML